jgi:AraC-like DNA-binding protein
MPKRRELHQPRAPIAVPETPVDMRGVSEMPSAELLFFLGRACIPSDYTGEVGQQLHPYHIHPGAEFALLTEGECHFYCEGQRHLVRQGDALFFDASVPHALGRASEADFIYHYWHVSFEALLSVPPTSVGLALVRACRKGAKGSARIVHLGEGAAQRMHDAWQSFHQGGAAGLLRAWGLALELGSQMLLDDEQRVTGTQTPSSGPAELADALMSAVSFINRHYAEPLTVKQIAAHCSLSASHLAHVFSDAMNYSPIEYRNMVRIHKAKELLLGSDHKIEAISTDVGFEHPGHFYRLFSRATGTSPARFRSENSAQG